MNIFIAPFICKIPPCGGYFTIFPSRIRMYYNLGQMALMFEESKQIIS